MTDPDLEKFQPLRLFSTIFGIASNNSLSTKIPDSDRVRESSLKSLDTPSSIVKGGFRREFLMAFFTIFLAELGDKTQLSTLLITAESRSPSVVFMGAASALITTSLLGVVIGRWLARYLSPNILQTATGATLLLISVLLLWDIVRF